MTTMKAVVRSAAGPALRAVPRPAAGAGEVVVRVAAAGVCRTDLYVADGRIPAGDGRVLGHEFGASSTRSARKYGGWSRGGASR